MQTYSVVVGFGVLDDGTQAGCMDAVQAEIEAAGVIPQTTMSAPWEFCLECTDGDAATARGTFAAIYQDALVGTPKETAIKAALDARAAP